jgi:2-haloacid dehalogenase
VGLRSQRAAAGDRPCGADPGRPRTRDHGFRLFTLTDNTLEISGRQLEKAGVIDLFERRFSVDESVRRHKPAPEAYHSVASALGLYPGDMCLIACHVWDTIGAVAAGWQAGLILREGNAPLDVGPQPNYIGADLDAIADELVIRYPASDDRPSILERARADAAC